MVDIKRKHFLYLSYSDAEKFNVVLNRALERDGRTNASEVIRELMGYPPKGGLRPVTTKEDRDFLAGRINTLSEGEDFPRPKTKPRIKVMRK